MDNVLDKRLDINEMIAGNPIIALPHEWQINYIRIGQNFNQNHPRSA
jgi:hypothetical protein